MDRKEAQILIHKKRLKELTRLTFEQFLVISDIELDNILSNLTIDETYELDHIISRLIYLKNNETYPDETLLNYLSTTIGA